MSLLSIEPVNVKLLELIILELLPATPFTAVVNKLPEDTDVTPVTTPTAVALIPFTLVVKLLPLIVLTYVELAVTALTTEVRSSVLLTPFTVLPKNWPVEVNVFELIILTGAVDIPFTDPLNKLPVEVNAFEFTILELLPATPFTAVVNKLPADIEVTPVTTPTAVASTPFTRVFKLLPLIVLLTDVELTIADCTIGFISTDELTPFM